MIRYVSINTDKVFKGVKGITTISACGSIECSVEEDPKQAKNEFADWVSKAEGRDGSVAALHLQNSSTILLQVVDGKPQQILSGPFLPRLFGQKKDQPLEKKIVEQAELSTEDWAAIFQKFSRFTQQQQNLIMLFYKNNNTPVHSSSLSSMSVMVDMNARFKDYAKLPYRVRTTERVNHKGGKGWENSEIRLFPR